MKRKSASPRRDSGYCINNNNGMKDEEYDVSDEDEVCGLEGLGRDSGMGSDNGSRAWGRREQLRKEQELVSRVEDAVSQLGKVGGKVRVVYTPKKHPNVPGLEGRTIIWETPAIDWQESWDQGELEHGFALKSLGVDEEEVLSAVLPDTAQVAGFLRNSVGLDLARIGLKEKRNREKVVFWLFKFFDISFPRELREEAFKMTWDFLRENLEYVNESDADEAEAFSNSMMQLPPDVVEMAAVLSSPCSPIHSFSPTSVSSLPQVVRLFQYMKILLLRFPQFPFMISFFVAGYLDMIFFSAGHLDRVKSGGCRGCRLQLHRHIS